MDPATMPAQKDNDRRKNNTGEIKETLLLRLNAKQTKGMVVRKNVPRMDMGNRQWAIGMLKKKA